MNDSYLRAGFPPSHQRPEDIKRMLEDAKISRGGGGRGSHAPMQGGTPGGGGMADAAAMGGGTGAMYESEDSIENAIREDLAQHPGSESLAHFIHQHQGR